MVFSERFVGEVKNRFAENEVLLFALEYGSRRQVEALLRLEAELQIDVLIDLVYKQDYEGLKQVIQKKFWATQLLKKFLTNEKPFGRSIRIKEK